MLSTPQVTDLEYALFTQDEVVAEQVQSDENIRYASHDFAEPIA